MAAAPIRRTCAVKHWWRHTGNGLEERRRENADGTGGQRHRIGLESPGIRPSQSSSRVPGGSPADGGSVDTAFSMMHVVDALPCRWGTGWIHRRASQSTEGRHTL